MKNAKIHFRFEQLKKCSDDIPFEMVIAWVYAAKEGQKKWWHFWI